MQRLKRCSFLRNLNKHRGLLLLALPGIILIFMFSYMPMFGLITAFKDYNYSLGIFGSEWCGFDNFKVLIDAKDTTIRIVRNTVLYWGMFTVIGTSLAVAVAIMINECTAKRLGKYAHTVMIFPTFVSWVAVSYIVKAFLGDSNGLVNSFLGNFGIDPVSWYTSPEYWPVILLIIHLWKGCGYGAVIYLSALSGMDPALFEAAELDGATKWQKNKYITIPLLKSLISIQVLLSLAGIMHSNTSLFYQVTRNTGVLYPTTQTIDAYVMNALSKGSDFGMTAAITLFQSVIGCVMVVLVNWIVRRKDEESALF